MYDKSLIFELFDEIDAEEIYRICSNDLGQLKQVLRKMRKDLV